MISQIVGQGKSVFGDVIELNKDVADDEEEEGEDAKDSATMNQLKFDFQFLHELHHSAAFCLYFESTCFQCA